MKRSATPRHGLKHQPDERKAETIDSATGKLEDTPPPQKRRIDLSTLRDVRLELAHVYRQMDEGALESADGTKRAYVLKTIADVITLSELEKRIQELEDRQAIPGAGPRALPERTLN